MKLHHLMFRTSLAAVLAGALYSPIAAAEVTIQNDAYGAPDAGTIVGNFAVSEQAAVWLTSSCDGKIVAVQVAWVSSTGTSPNSIEQAVRIHAPGSFPTPGTVRAEVLGPLLDDPFINEFRYLDENNLFPISVPVLQGEQFVVAFEFANPTNIAGGTASVIRDAAATPNRNAIRANFPPLTWVSAPLLGVNGDFVIRAVVDCVPPDPPSGPIPANLATGVSTGTTLDWSDTGVARTYSVKLWKSVDAEPGTPTASGLAVSSYTPGAALDAGTAYSWRVSVTNNNGTTNGPVWTFTTAPGASVADWTAY